MSWFVVGGIAIGATAGAIAGSKKGGDDVWKGALIGGAVGGVGGWAAAPAAAGAAPAAGAALAPEAATAIGGGTAFGGTGAATVGAVGGMAPEAAAGAGILGAGGAGAGSAGTIAGGAGTAGGVSGLYGSGAGLGSSVVPSAYSSVGSGLTAGSSAGLPSVASGAGGATGSSVGAAGFAPGMQAPIQMASAPATTTPPPSALEKGFGSALKWMGDNPMQAGILGIGAMSLTGMLNQDNDETFGNSTVTPAGYPLASNFKPSRVNPQQYRYASSYADGGPVQSGMFPQSQMDKTQFATPSQMPVSREVVGADYDALTNPYTGDMPRFAQGKEVDSGKLAKQYTAMIDRSAGASTSNEHAPTWVGRSVANVNDPGVFIDRDDETATQDAYTAAGTNLNRSARRANVKLATMQKPTPMGKLNLGPVTDVEEKASGGITGLGGYAHGGNARLLKGPGDGMSDDIPATIADKQPARLADGEFVVPADVVSGLGNGSTEAGAKKLHQMMDKVRVDRTGTKKQGKQIKAEKYIPGMAEGGIAHFDEGGSTGLGYTNPNTLFDPDWYLTNNPDVAASEYYRGDPYRHYLEAGKAEGRAAYGGASGTSALNSTAAASSTPVAMGDQGTPDYRMPGSTLSGGLGRWSNVAGEQQRASRIPSINQQITQSYLQNLGRAPDQQGFNYWMQQANAPTNEANFSSETYLRNNPDVAAAIQNGTYGGTAYEHYRKYGVNEGRLGVGSNVPAVLNDIGRSREATGTRYASVATNPQAYLNANPDVAAAIANKTYTGTPFQHYNDWGSVEGRQATPSTAGTPYVAAQQNPTAAPVNATVATLYDQYLGRAPESSGAKYWTNQLTSGALSPEQLRSAIQNSEEGKKYAAAHTQPEKKRKGGILAAKK